MPTSNHPKRTEKNVIDSDGTLIISHGKLTGGSPLTREMADKHDRPWIHIDLNTINAFDAAQTVKAWIESYKIKILNVAGSRASKDSLIYEATKKVFKFIVYLDIIGILFEVNSKSWDFYKRISGNRTVF